MPVPHSIRSPTPAWGLFCAIMVQALACVQTSSSMEPARVQMPGPKAREGPASDGAMAARPMLGMTWNVTWFQDPERAPHDDALQYSHVRDVLAEWQPALIAPQELSSADAFERLLADLSPLAGVLSGYAWVQKTALLWD